MILVLGSSSVPENEALDHNAASDLWRNTLSQIPSVFGRLVYLSGLRNANTDRYEHHGLALVFGEVDAHNTLRRSHSKSFQEWLCFNLEQQRADLELYLAGLEENRKTVLAAWRKLSPYRGMIPSSAKTPERRLYVADLTALLELLRNEYGVDGPDPNASPHP